MATDESGVLFERVQELQALLDDCEQSAARDLAEELMSTVLQLYGSGLERILDGILASGPEGARIASELVEDPLVATLLLIHDLHPIPLQERVQHALDSVRPYMDSHGGNVELLSLENGVARIRLQGSCSDCSASSVTLELAIKQALEDAAPDLEGLEVEGIAPQMPGSALPMVSGANGAELPVMMSPAWFEVDPGGEPASGSLVAVTVAGSELLIANVDGTLLAYRDACAQCGGALHDGRLTEGALHCPQCERAYFLPRAGRSMDDDRLQLEPVPLLRDQGRVKVALAG
ncbi:MAG TPA: NifU family protein [Solirubrobacteraceae bacterium]|nr:NifU family protein [Solirubrobacteraceae bacterium]